MLAKPRHLNNAAPYQLHITCPTTLRNKISMITQTKNINWKPSCCQQMLLTEWIRLRDFKGGRSRLVLGKEVPAWLWEAYKVIGVYLFGCACQQLTTDIAKYTIGRLRPHFFDVSVAFLTSLTSTALWTGFWHILYPNTADEGLSIRYYFKWDSHCFTSSKRVP